MRPFGLILSLAPLAVLADVEFTSPAPGADVPAGTIEVSWKESGIDPPIADLTAYTLVLMVGGNDDADMLPLTTFVSGGNFNDNKATGTIPSGIAGPLTNGFFFKIISTSSTGGNVINYSDRFTITGLTGSTAPQYRDAVVALDGSTKGPDSVGDASPTSSSASATVTSAPSSQQPTASTMPTTLRTFSSTPSTMSPSSSSNSPNGSSDNSGGGISSGALVGVAIAGVVVGLLGIGLALWGCLRRKRRRDDPTNKSDDDHSDLSAEVYRKEMVVNTPPVELDPWSRIVEADDGAPPAEMDGTAIRAELEGDSMHMRPNSCLTEVPPTPISPMTLGNAGTGTWDSMRFGLPDPKITPETPGTPVTPRDHV